jgi:hypothetical protein
MVVLWCVSLLAAHVGDASFAPNDASNQPDGWELLDNSAARAGYRLWGTLDIPDFRFSAPPENHAVKLTYAESYQELPRRFLLQQNLAAPVTFDSGTLSLNLHLDERTVSQDLWPLQDLSPTVGSMSSTAIDQNSARVAGKWEDRNKDEIEASVTWRFEAPYSAQPVEGVALSLKSMLPPVWLPWYLQGEVRADSTRADQEAVSLTADYHAADVSHILASLGVTRRDYSKGPRERQGSYIVNTGCQWRQDDHLGLGISVKYYVDEHSVESILYLQLGQPVRAP